MDVLAQDRRFSRLMSALKKAELAETLQLGAYTVFAPTNKVGVVGEIFVLKSD